MYWEMIITVEFKGPPLESFCGHFKKDVFEQCMQLVSLIKDNSDQTQYLEHISQMIPDLSGKTNNTNGPNKKPSSRMNPLKLSSSFVQWLHHFFCFF